MNKFDFLTSRKFYAILIFAAATWLLKDGYISAGLAEFLQTLSGLFVGINMGNKVIEAFGKTS